MNTSTRSQIVLLTLSALAGLVGCGQNEQDHGHAHEGHDAHDHSHHGHSHAEEPAFAKEAGPNGGRLIVAVSPAAEFLLASDRKATLSFFDDQRQPIAPAGQSATLVAGDRLNPTQLEFIRQGDVLVSSDALPAGDGYPVSLQIQSAPDSPPIFERFNLHTHTCSGCNLQEYACICGH